MPTKPNSACLHPGCSERPDGAYCEKHRKDNRSNYHKPEYHKKYDTKRWDRWRKRFLDEHELCEHCKQKGILRSATVVDHIEPHRGDPDLFWDWDNLQALCEKCHNRKTGKGK